MPAAIIFNQFRVMLKVNRNRPVMSKQHLSSFSSFSPGHSRDVRTGQSDPAGVGHGHELMHLVF